MQRDLSARWSWFGGQAHRLVSSFFTCEQSVVAPSAKDEVYLFVCLF